jgi:hypothetical protein
MMISKECEFSEFISAVRDKDYFDVIELAEREVTAAERFFLRVGGAEPLKTRCGKNYSQRIKQLIAHMRYEVKLHPRLEKDAAVLAAFELKRKPRRGL